LKKVPTNRTVNPQITLTLNVSTPKTIDLSSHCQSTIKIEKQESQLLSHNKTPESLLYLHFSELKHVYKEPIQDMLEDLLGFSYHAYYVADCGNTLAAGSGPAPSIDCNMACTSNTTEACGSLNRLNLFWSRTLGSQINPRSGLWSFVGCYA